MIEAKNHSIDHAIFFPSSAWCQCTLWMFEGELLVCAKKSFVIRYVHAKGSGSVGQKKVRLMFYGFDRVMR